MIDFHAHVAYYKLYSDKFLHELFSANRDSNILLQKAVSVVKLFLKDEDCSQLLKQMDEAEIEKTILLMVDDNECFGKTGITIEESYQLHYKIQKLHPERFVIFAGYHAKRGQVGIDLLKKGIEHYGFSGVKLYPPYGFRIDDPLLVDCYEYCNKLGLPILIHTGPSIKGLENGKAEPIAIGKVAEQYHNINFIMAHAGYKLGDPIIQNLLLRTNIYADISGFQIVLDSGIGKNVLNQIFKDPFNHKILYGSDWPITNLMKSLANQINIIKEIEQGVANKAEDALENILRKNAQRVLKFL